MGLRHLLHFLKSKPSLFLFGGVSGRVFKTLLRVGTNEGLQPCLACRHWDGILGSRWWNAFLSRKWQSPNTSHAMTLRRALLSILLNGPCWSSYSVSQIHLSSPPKMSGLNATCWTKLFYSLSCLKETGGERGGNPPTCKAEHLASSTIYLGQRQNKSIPPLGQAVYLRQ